MEMLVTACACCLMCGWASSVLCEAHVVKYCGIFVSVHYQPDDAVVVGFNMEYCSLLGVQGFGLESTEQDSTRSVVLHFVEQWNVLVCLHLAKVKFSLKDGSQGPHRMH